ncbi:hypothetical protein D3C78_1262640 [compost metagenome]
MVKTINPKLYKKISAHEIQYSDLCIELRLNILDAENELDKKLKGIMKWIKFSILPEAKFRAADGSDDFHGLEHSLWNYNINREELIDLYCAPLNMFNINN